MPNEEPIVLWPGWETVRLIGRGSFGAVYEIRRELLGNTEKAALKLITIPENRSEIEMLLDEGYDDASVKSTFQEYLKGIVDEYSLMRKLNGSANVVNCDDVRYEQHEDGFGWDIFIKMELLTPLTKALGKEIPDSQVIRIGADICKALALCRKHNIVHRDIKPANIFVSDNGDYKLGDFGIAKTVERTRGGTKIGTYDYMAPEVFNNQPYGAGADIYSLGVVLYWLLNDKRTPFLPLPPATPTAAEKEQARVRRFCGESTPAPAHGSPALQQVVLKALAFDPRDRYQSAEELLRDLEAVQAGNSEFGVRDSELDNDDRTGAVPHPPAAPGSALRDPGVDREGPSRSASPRRKRWLPILLGIVAVLVVVPVLILLPGRWQSDDVLPTVAPARTPQITIATIPPFESKAEETALSSAEPEASQEPSGPIMVGVIHLDPNESGYRKANVNDLYDTFTKENGYDAVFRSAATHDEQLEAARWFISTGVDYLLVSPAQDSGWDEVLQEAKDAGIGVFLFDRMIDCDPALYTAAVVSDMRLEGETAVAWLESLSLEEYKILHIQGCLGSEAQIGRSDPMNEKCAGDKKWTMVHQGTGGAGWDSGEAYGVTWDAIAAGEEFNVVYAESDSLAAGAAAALEEAGISHGVNGDVIIVSFDCNKWALRELLAGNWNYDGQCSPFQAGPIDRMIKTLEEGGSIEGLNERKQYINEEKGFDARNITPNDVETYGLGD